jgi:hypothetical protein
VRDAHRDRPFVRQRGHHEALVARFDRQLEAYRRAHPRAGEAELMAHAESLLAAMPGLQEAFAYRGLRGAVTAVLIADCGDGLPLSGPSAAWDADGERPWTQVDQWTLDDYRLNLAWYREPGAPPTPLAALIAHGETRWPGVDLSRGPWPDTSDLPDREDLECHLDAMDRR